MTDRARKHFLFRSLPTRERGGCTQWMIAREVSVACRQHLQIPILSS
jgi:hypothetical protein